MNTIVIFSSMGAVHPTHRVFKDMEKCNCKPCLIKRWEDMVRWYLAATAVTKEFKD